MPHIDSENPQDYEQIIQAREGWSLVDFIHNEAGNAIGYDLQPILAWRMVVEFWGHGNDVRSHVAVYPITIEGDEKGIHQCFWLRSPDGIYKCPFEQDVWKSGDLMLKAKNEELKEIRERRKAKEEKDKTK